MEKKLYYIIDCKHEFNKTLYVNNCMKEMVGKIFVGDKISSSGFFGKKRKLVKIGYWYFEECWVIELS